MITNSNRLPDEVYNILKSYEFRNRNISLLSDCYGKLLVSLYCYLNKANCNLLAETYEEGIFDVKTQFSREELDLLIQNFNHVADFCLNHYGRDIVNSSEAERTQPYGLTWLIARLMHIGNGSRVYLPFAGYASELMMLNNCYVQGEEINVQTQMFANLRLQDSMNQGHIRCADSLEELKIKDNSFDYVFFTPPFSVNRHDHRTEYDVVKLAIENKLREGGQLCCILPSIFLTSASGSAYRCREYIVKHGYLRAAITLPAIFDPVSRTCPVMVIVEKQESDTFILVDGSSFLSSNTALERRPKLKVSSLYETIKSVDGGYCKIMHRSDLYTNYTLNPAHYLYKLPELQEGYKYYKLSEVADFVGIQYGVSYNTISSRCPMPNFLVEKLYDDYTNCEVVKLPVSRNYKAAYEITAPVVMAQIIFGKMKIGKISTNGSEVIGTLQPTYIMQVKKNIITEDYLLKMLLSDIISSQIKAFSSRGTLPYLPKESFYDLVIPVPSLERQKDITMGELHQSLENKDLVIQNELEEYKKDVRMKKHAVGQLLFSLNSNWSLLQLIKDMNNGVIDESMIMGDAANPIVVKDILEGIDAMLKKVNIAIENFTIGENEQYPEEEFSIDKFVTDYISDTNDVTYSFIFQPSGEAKANREIVREGNTLFHEGDFIRLIKFSTKALERILLDITTNAKEYGFKRHFDTQNKILVRITQEDSNYILWISNNGEPLNQKIQLDDVFKYGVTTSSDRSDHSGIGGYEIKKIMERFGGKVEIFSTPLEEYTVTYKLTFTETNANDLGELL